MTRWLFVPCAAAACLALGPGPAGARDLPPPPSSTCPSYLLIHALGPQGGPDPGGAFVVVVRDLANEPVPGSDVAVDLSECLDLRLCDVAIPWQLFTPPTRAWHAVSDANGVARFVIPGGSTGAASVVTGPCARIYADGIFQCRVPVAILDLDAAGGLGASDIALWLAGFAGGTPGPRADFDGSGTVGAADLAVWLGVAGRGTSVASCGAFLP